MGWLRAILIISVLWINGCTSSKAVQKNKVQPLTMMDIYAQSAGQAQKDVTKFIENNLKEEKTFGYVKPYIPVMNDPVVRKVWIPDHKSEDNPDVMIAGHWSYVMIQPPTWFIDGKTVEAQLPVIVPSESSIHSQSQKPNH
ncbi:MAG: hypothetical protein HY209_07525 [Candidatus Omnitrophica bacterium]|nr:hypothetical protein [Candidatus Omnitrophota bacterium]